MWTKDGEDKGAVTTVGKPMEVSFNAATGVAYAVFRNPGTTAITYSAIQLFKNNNMANFTVEGFDQPTGTSVSAPATISLSPGALQSVSFGAVDAKDTFQFAVAQVSEDSAPGVLYNLATAATPDGIPTLSEWGLAIMVSFLLLAGILLLRRRNISTSKPS